MEEEDGALVIGKDVVGGNFCVSSVGWMLWNVSEEETNVVSESVVCIYTFSEGQKRRTYLDELDEMS